jgi:hypothetical protein
MKKDRTEEESIELENLIIESETRELTRDEKIRMNLLMGHDQEWAEWIADHGYPRE